MGQCQLPIHGMIACAWIYPNTKGGQREKRSRRNHCPHFVSLAGPWASRRNGQHALTAQQLPQLQDLRHFSESSGMSHSSHFQTHNLQTILIRMEKHQPTTLHPPMKLITPSAVRLPSQGLGSLITQVASATGGIVHTRCGVHSPNKLQALNCLTEGIPSLLYIQS